MREIRCTRCAKLLARGEAVYLEIRCPRCKTDNTVRAESPDTRNIPHTGELYGQENPDAPFSRMDRR